MSNNDYISKLLYAFNKYFAMRHLGELKHFLGIEFIPTSIGLILSQQQYILQFLKNARMENYKSSPTPLATNKVFESGLDLPYTDPKAYRSLV